MSGFWGSLNIVSDTSDFVIKLRGWDLEEMVLDLHQVDVNSSSRWAFAVDDVASLLTHLSRCR